MRYLLAFLAAAVAAVATGAAVIACTADTGDQQLRMDDARRRDLLNAKHEETV